MVYHLDREQRREPPRPRARLIVDGVERKGRAAHVHLDLAPDVRSPAFPFYAVYNETRAGARRLAALLAV